MNSFTVQPPYANFSDVDGEPLESGYIYIGEAGLNPETNPISVYFDSALTIPAAQPLRTIGGFVSNNGSPANIFISDTSCSIIIRNKNNTLVFTNLNANFQNLFGEYISFKSMNELLTGSVPPSVNQVFLNSYNGVVYPSTLGPRGAHYRHRVTTVPANAGTIVGAVAYDSNGVGWMFSNDQKVTPTSAGALGNWQNDDGPAIQKAFNVALSLASIWTNTAPGENPSSGSLPPVEFEKGIYLSTVPLTDSIAYSYIDVKGNGAIVADSPLRSVTEGLRFASDCNVDGLEIRGFQTQIVIDVNNVNQSSYWFTNCHFQKPLVAVFSFEKNPQSGILVIERCTANPFDGSKFLYMPTLARRIDFLSVKDLWLQPALNSSNTFNIDGTLMDVRSSFALFDHVVGVPTGVLSPSIPASWMRFYGTNLEIRHCNFGSELTGGCTAVENFSGAADNGQPKVSISISNSRLTTSGTRPQIRLFKLPNVITLIGIIGDGTDGGIEYVDATDAAGIAESSGIDIDNLDRFALSGTVNIDNLDNIVSRQPTMGIHAGLAYQMVLAAHYYRVGVPYREKIKVNDLVCCTAYNQGTRTVGSTSTSGADSIDYRGVPVRTRTATADGAGYFIQWIAFLDYLMIGAAPSGVDLSFTLLVELDYSQAKQGSGLLTVQIARTIRQYQLQSGNVVYAVPFVYFNTSNAANANLDRLNINVSSMSNGDAIAFKRIVVVRGFQQTGIEQITAYQEGVATPSDVANTYFDSNAGWVKGDRVLNLAASTDPNHYICTTEQTGTTVWGSGGAIT